MKEKGKNTSSHAEFEMPLRLMNYNNLQRNESITNAA